MQKKLIIILKLILTKKVNNEGSKKTDFESMPTIFLNIFKFL